MYPHGEDLYAFEKRHRYVGAFEIIEMIGPVTYKLKIAEELNAIHDIFHVSNIKKCLAEDSLNVPLKDLQINNQLKFVDEPI